MNSELIYYVRSCQTRQILATVALVKSPESVHPDSETWCRGIALVGDGDQPCRFTGRSIALGRAHWAADHMCNRSMSRGVSWGPGSRIPTSLRAVFEVLQEGGAFLKFERLTDRPFLWKAEYDCALADDERQMVRAHNKTPDSARLPDKITVPSSS